MAASSPAVVALRKRLVAEAILERGPLHDRLVADVLAEGGVPISDEPVAIGSYCRTLKRIGLIDRTEPFGPAVWKLTRKGQWLAMGGEGVTGDATD